MMDYWNTFLNETSGTVNWVISLVLFQVPWYQNYFWGLILISLLVWFLEMTFPWRRDQAIFRRDFWLDAFYMFFNFFLFAIVISGVYKLIQVGAENGGITRDKIALLDVSSFPIWIQLIVFFLVLDLVQWFTHVLLHKIDVLWQFHKVHHSVIEMGFAAHLRYHWMENILYKPLKTLGVMLLGGFEPQMAFVVHFFAIAIGHFNHANIKITWGPMKYIFNNPVMHLWHHAKSLPQDRSKGVNYGISLSLWDYLFKTNYIPTENGEIDLGFDGVEKFPKTFWGQLIYGFTKDKT